MIIRGVLTQDQLKQLHAAMLEVRWLDGKATAGSLAGPLKNNEQADLKDRRGAQISQQLSMAIGSNVMLRSAALPKQLSPLRLSRTKAGGNYGTHFDNAIMSAREGMMRTDLSFTLFLNAPEHYEGGALAVYDDGQESAHKLPAGDLVLYPSGALHEVREVISGARIVCVGWIQSLVPSADKRQILFELGQLGLALQETLGTQDAQTRSAQKLYADLTRQWAEI